jgi:hypothetical protein
LTKPYSDSRWRNHAAPIIARVIAAHPDADERALRKLISAEYPFGQRAYHPYKIWLDELGKQVDRRFGRVTIRKKRQVKTPKPIKLPDGLKITFGRTLMEQLRDHRATVAKDA